VNTIPLHARLELLIKDLFRRLGIDIRRIHSGHQGSETSLARARLLPFCAGNGLDLGPGGDPISLTAVRVDLPNPYFSASELPVQLSGSADNLYWFKDSCLDYIYSSHLLEDFQDTAGVLQEWLRVLKPGGKLIIYCPDEQLYRAYCLKKGQPYNFHHVHADFSLEKVKTILSLLGGCRMIYEQEIVDDYSWELVAEKAPSS
jgi:SAM-dependent methyltransferase